MALPINTIIILVVVFFSVGITLWIFSCCGGGVLIRRLFHCTTTEDEEAQERRHANRRNRALAARLGDGTFVPRNQATAGNNIYNPWAAQPLVSQHDGLDCPPPYPQPPAGSYHPGTYHPGRGYPCPAE